MINSVFQRLLGKKVSQPQALDGPKVDISRVIPGYVSPTFSDQADTPPAPLLVSIELKEDDVSAESLAEASVNTLKDKHEGWAKDDIAQLVYAWKNTKSDDMSHADLSSVRLAAHNLKGMAGNYGHPAIARIATSLCKLIDSPSGAPEQALINLHVEACRAAFLEGHSNEGSNDIASAVCSALEAQVSRTLKS